LAELSAGSARRDRPKSTTRALSSASMRMLSGLKSPWMTPASCAACRPSPAWIRTSSDLLPAALLGLEPHAERLALHELHGEEHLLLDAADLVDLDDVGVRELGHGPGLALHAGLVARAVVAAGAQQLEGDAAVELLVVGGVDDAHAALAEGAQDGEAADAGRLPAQNALPSPDSTTARTRLSAMTCSPAAMSASIIGTSRPLRLSGRCRRTSATPPARDTRTRGVSALMAGSVPAGARVVSCPEDAPRGGPGACVSRLSPRNHSGAGGRARSRREGVRTTLIAGVGSGAARGRAAAAA
jgi:hypothetical protein